VADPLQREVTCSAIRAIIREPVSARNHECVLYSAVHQAQLCDPLWPEGGDPLRNGNDDASRLGARFGADCFEMGQVLGDPRFRQPATRRYRLVSHCDNLRRCDVPLLDIWARRKPKHFCPVSSFIAVQVRILCKIQPHPLCCTRQRYGWRRMLLTLRPGCLCGLSTKGKDAINSVGDPYRTQPEWPNNPSRGIQLPLLIEPIADAVVLVLESGYEVVSRAKAKAVSRRDDVI